MRVLWFIDSLGPGGAEKLMLPVLKNLRELEIDNRVCTFRNRAGNPIAEELKAITIPVDMIPVKNLRSPFILRQLANYIRKYQPDIIHTQLETSDILGTMAARMLNIPSVSTIHTMEKPSRRIKKVWRNFLRWNCLKFISTRIIAVSEVTRQHYINLGFGRNKLVRMYNGIDLNTFARDTLQATSKYELFGLPEDSTILTTVAVLREQKGIQYMLQALPELLARSPNVYYVIVGDGDYRETLENMAKSLGISDHVLFLQYRKDIPEILAASNLFVFPSLGDALPTVLLEAMAAGLPIVASKVGGIPEVISHEINGLLVPPADPKSLAEACLRLLGDKKLTDGLTSAGRDIVLERFDVRQQAQNLSTLYNQILHE